LVPLYELGCEDDLWFFTMERVHGVDFLTGVRGALGPDPPGQTVKDEQDTTWSTISNSSVRLQRRRAVQATATPTPPPSIPPIRRARAPFLQRVGGGPGLREGGSAPLARRPSTVLVEGGGRAVALDFGLVKAVRAPAPSPPSPDSVRRGPPGKTPGGQP